MSYENSAFIASAENDGVVYEFQYDDRVEVRSAVSVAPTMEISQFLEWLEEEDFDLDVVVLLADANANARNAAENFDGVGVEHVEYPGR